MNEEIKTKQAPRNRVTLTEACVNRLGQWESQIAENLRGVSVRSSDLVEWLIMDHSAELSPEELQEMQSLFYDDIAVAAWALRELKRAKAAGEPLTLQQVLGQRITGTSKRSAGPKRKGSSENEVPIGKEES